MSAHRKRGGRLCVALAALVIGLAGLVVIAGPADASVTPVLAKCDGGTVRRPATIQNACGDGNGYFDRIQWSTWGSTEAVGTARQWANTCNPNCAAGNYRKPTVRITLYRPIATPSLRYFSRIQVGGAYGYRSVTPSPRAGCASNAEFNQVHRGDSRTRVARVFGTDGRGTKTHRAYPYCAIRGVFAEVWFSGGHVTSKHWSDD